MRAGIMKLLQTTPITIPKSKIKPLVFQRCCGPFRRGIHRDLWGLWPPPLWPPFPCWEINTSLATDAQTGLRCTPRRHFTTTMPDLLANLQISPTEALNPSCTTTESTHAIFFDLVAGSHGRCSVTSMWRKSPSYSHALASGQCHESNPATTSNTRPAIGAVRG